jgi:hypothetical protein
MILGVIELEAILKIIIVMVHSHITQYELISIIMRYKMDLVLVVHLLKEIELETILKIILLVNTFTIILFPIIFRVMK